jgi:hypothetical protein
LDQDGSALTHIIDPEETCPQSTIRDDPEAVAQVEVMRWMQEPEEMEELWLCPVEALMGRLKEVEHDCHCGISLEVHDMEIQFWEALTPDEIPYPPTLENIYAVLQQRLAQRSPNRALAEWVPITKEQVDTECDKRGRIWRIKFTPRDVMGTAASGSQEHVRVTSNRGYRESGITGKYTAGLPTRIFKARVPDWQPILAARASRDVMNVIDIGTLTEWEPEQDLSQDNREINMPSRIVEEKGRGTIIRKDRDFLRLLDNQAAM